MLRSGRQIDPRSVDLPAGDPVPADDMVRWRTEMTGRFDLLESIPGAGPVRTFLADVEPEYEAEQQSSEGASR
jgi:hypothetical protein